MRYNALREIGLTEEQIKDNLMFTAEKIGDAHGDRDVATGREGLVRRDAARPVRDRAARAAPTGSTRTCAASIATRSTLTGWNNLVYPNVGMPHVLWKLQGERVARGARGQQGRPADPRRGRPAAQDREAGAAHRPARSRAVEYDKTVYDLVNFLAWMGEPHQMARKRLGSGC